MKTLRYFIPIITLLFASCQMIVSVDIPEHKPSIVINSVIDTEEPVRVHLSKSLGALDRAQLSPINNAEVEIYEEGVLIEKASYKPGEEGFYYFQNVVPKPGKKYKVVASASPYEQASAITQIPGNVQVSNIVLKDSVYQEDYAWFSSISITIHDPANEANYYMVEMFQKDSLDNLYPAWLFSRDPALSDDYYSKFIFSDESFNGKAYRLEGFFYRMTSQYDWDEVNQRPVEYFFEDDFILKFSSISKEFYLYERTLTKQLWSDPFFSEPVQVFTNVENGLGILGGKSSQTIEVKK